MKLKWMQLSWKQTEMKDEGSSQDVKGEPESEIVLAMRNLKEAETRKVIFLKCLNEIRVLAAFFM